MAEKKGIRVNALAKELGVESKAILSKLRDEGLGDAAPNHMSMISLGLSESVREWFSSGDGGTAVQTAPPIAATKPKRPRTGTKSRSDDATTDGDGAEPTTPPVAPVEPEFVEPVAPVVEAPEVVVDEPAVEEPEVQPEYIEPPVVADVPPYVAPYVEPAAPVAPQAPVAHAPVPHAPAPHAPTHVRPPHGPGHDPARVAASRPTITLGPTRGPGPANIERRPVVQAPRLTELTPATIQGPRVVRVEKADNLPAPRPRRPMGDGPQGPGPGYTTARPITGRGVKVSDEEEEEAKKKAAAKAGRTNSQRRRGPDGRRGEAMEKLREFTEADLIARKDALNAASASRAAFESHLKKAGARGTHAIAKTTVQRGEPVEIEEPITVKSLASALGIKVNDIITKLMRQGIFATINQSLDHDTAGSMALEYGVELKVASHATMEEELLSEFTARSAAAENLVARPPVVTILGHVDHGKTSLLDKIRNANVAAGEAGGITQHTAAWGVEISGSDGAKKRVTFIDTPGHQAFTSMRARGANMTDVVVLVVAAVEGVMPQTVESINHARAAGVPIVVALNKIDRPDANPDMVLGQLASNGLNPVEWGGDIEVIRTSATTGQGIKELIEILDYQAELLELKADPTAPARGTVIEAKMDAGLGPIATVLVQDGTLKVGDVMLSGAGYGRIRNLLNDRGEMIQEAGPSTAVIVAGLSALPGSGDKMYTVDDFDRAREIATERSTLNRAENLASRNQVTHAGNLLENLRAGDTKTINLIIKGDVQGSVETLVATVTGQNTEEVKVRVIHSGVGPITESDVHLAMATKTKPTDNRVAIIGFHVVPEEPARLLAEQNHVDYKTYRVIYEIFDDLKKSLSGMLAPEVREKLHGHVEVRQVFKVSRLGNIAGCMVIDGHVQRGSKVRLLRGGVIVTEELAIETLRRGKDDVKEAKSGFECGIKLANYDDIKIGDVFECYIRETFERTL